ncbi:MarR family winged helix-turn-helix transcriptional regulator [Corynebacterium tapiri]|uniref:MarR family transcriptional regulator n=1 Tax=Corynebacterium tapiri TaxID=1448266 RepID=A0A5C4U5C0_9CORY|nr:MarR family transcriptional regulator [Corynebacterium tapiri]TNL99376.1 MarR family transcriptional regulator [Corynebacterium tapiri]
MTTPTPRFHPISRRLFEVLKWNDEIAFQAANTAGMNATDFRAVQLLLKQGPHSPTDLAKRLHLTNAATTTVIDRLVARGHVTRATHPQDRRRTVVEATPTAYAQVMSMLAPVLAESEDIVAALSPEEQDTVLRYLKAIESSLKAHTQRLEQGAAGGQ